MLSLLFVLSLYSVSCLSQYVYNGLLPYDPRYALHRPPVRRSAIEALERLRLPINRYFPQVETQAVPVPYQGGAPVAAYSGYQMQPAGEQLYALPAQWTAEDLVQPSADEDDYGNYEYEGGVYRSPQAPAYAEEVYPRMPEVDPEDINDAYNDVMSSYLMGMRQQQQQPELFDTIQRRNEPVVMPNRVVNQVTGRAVTDSTTTTSPLSAPVVPSQLPTPQVQMTAVPASPEKKNIKSLVVPDAVPEEQGQRTSSWREMGQKEEPLFRPLQTSQRTTWSEMAASPLSRVKNTPQNKSSIPLLKQMIQTGKQQQQSSDLRDPLLEELASLKKKV